MENAQKILVTGGAGYIGTNILSVLLEQNYNVVVIDNLSNSYKEHIETLCKKYAQKLRFLQFDLLDDEMLKGVFEKEKFDAVIHLAGKKYVQESFLYPDEYYEQNVKITQKILYFMRFYGIKRLIFPSSVTVYGNCEHFPVAENEELKPISPYSKNKKECEDLIRVWQNKTGFSATVLRLSNPIGANVELNLGDDPKNKKYMGVLPYIISKVKSGEELKFNGNNHNTKDGTTVRDYIHVQDVATAFYLALTNCNTNKFVIYNIGYGEDGFSVLEILKEVEDELGVKAKYIFGPKKEGDMSIFISNTQKANKKLGFVTKYNLCDMVKSQVDEFEYQVNKQDAGYFESERLLYRTMSSDVDFDDFCEIFDNEYIDKYVKRMNKEQVQRYFDKKEKQGTNKYSIAVILKENNKMIGNIGLKVIDEKVGNLSYVFNYKYWNKGYCSEACKTIINKAFSEWGFDEILADCEDYNIASKRILEKLGFEFLYKKSGDTLHHATHEPLTFLYFSLKNSTK